jgi:hypothetical protein
MFYEKAVTTHNELMRELSRLDEDSGVRLSVKRGGKGYMVFITRFGDNYTLMTYSLKDGVPGKRLDVLETDDLKAISSAVKLMSPGRVDAHVY